MPVVVIATPGADNANSYATVAEASAYHQGHLTPDAWVNAELDSKNRALVTATRLLDQHMIWIGRAATESQSLGWPRIYARTRNGYLYSHDVVPTAVKDATSELARRLLESGMPDAAGGDTENIKRMKAGPVDIEFRENATTDLFPDAVYNMVKFLATQDDVGGIRAVPVIRT